MINPQLETFVTIAKVGSFSKAAETLFISPTAVMKQINALEDHLGITLFIRNNQGLQLTDAGKELLEDAKYIIEYSTRAIEKAKELANYENKKPVRIGTSVMTPAKFLLDMWTNFQKHYSNMPIELIPFENTPKNAQEILRNLGKNIDVVAGIYDDSFLLERGCQAIHLNDKTIALAVPLDHPLSNKKIIKVSDLEDCEIMLITKGWKVVEKMREDLISKNIRLIDFDFFNLDAFNKAATKKVPIMAIDGWENVHPLLKIIPVEWEYMVPFGIMYSLAPSQEVKSFIRLVGKNI